MGQHSKQSKKEQKVEEEKENQELPKQKKDKKSKKSKASRLFEEEKKEAQEIRKKAEKKDKKQKKNNQNEDEGQNKAQKKNLEQQVKKQKEEKNEEEETNEEMKEEVIEEQKEEQKIKTDKKKRKRSSDSTEDTKKKLKQEDKEIIIKPKEEFEAFVGGLSFDAKDKDLRELFGKKVVRVNILRKQNGKSRGIAFITFKKQKHLEKACKLNETEFMGKVIKVNKSNHQKMPQAPTLPDTNQVFIGNLNATTEESKIRSFFERCGSIKKITYGTNAEGKNKGFCHVEFSNPLAVEKALNLTGSKLDGKQIRVDVAKQLN